MGVVCNVLFEHNPQGIFYAGQTIVGSVELILDKPKKVRGVSLKLLGHAVTSWTEQEHRAHHHNHNHNRHHTHHHHNHTQVVRYHGDENYLQTLTFMVGSPSGPQITLPAGKHTHPFSCVLPGVLPSSFEGKMGFVRYSAKVTLERPWKFDQSYTTAFTVLSPLDLNMIPSCRTPLQGSNSKTFWCGFCSSGDLQLSAQIPVTGFVPGQQIVVTCEVINNSKVSVNEIKFQLKQLISYRSDFPRVAIKSETKTVAERRAVGVAKGCSLQVVQALHVPSVPSSHLYNCRLIDVVYEVLVEASVQGVHRNLSLVLPVTIGTVPLYPTSLHTTDVTRYPGDLGSDPVICVPPGPSAPLGESLYEAPPPTYEESVFGGSSLREDGEDATEEDKGFTPRYPVFKFPEPTAPPSYGKTND